MFEKKRLIVTGILLMIIATFIDLLSPLVMKQIIDSAIPEKNFKALFIFIAILTILPILSTIFRTVRMILNVKIGGNVTEKLRTMAFEKAFTLSSINLNQLKIGDIVDRLTRTSGMIGEVYIANELLNGITSLFMFLGMTLFMLTISWKLTLIAFLVVPLVFFITFKLGRISETKTKSYMEYTNNEMTFFTELISGIKNVQIFSQQQSEMKNVKSLLKKHKELHLNTSIYRRSYADIFNQLVKSLALGIVFAVGAWDISNNQLTIGSLVAFTVYVPQLYTLVNDIQTAYIGTTNVRPIIKQLNTFLDIQEPISEIPNAIPLKNVKGEIEFENVSFTYENNRASLQNVSFKVQPGETIGIVGGSGGGKTTILELLMRFYDPTEGAVCIDGVDISKYNLIDFRNAIGLVTQDPFLWNRTIKENLIYGVPTATKDQILHAIKVAQLEEFIDSLPEGYETVVGERGVRISGGEKQRLAIARAILKDPPIILLDEPTSALDANTEFLLQSQMEEVFKGKTIVLVAHRLATIRNASKVLVLDNGEIVEFGTPNELLNKKGAYFDLLSKQVSTN
ncbi:ABC transporter ATP-binding protein [Viridibacillus arvi]|uniref:ABC transporter ATP-binding protein n=1 Tax=Viridibacillus arvi TaxID=263475 RepID=UPI00187B26E3|nr:ABC transporter ATP-binding protein [Viridibacillus sp. JNUCC-6]QOV12269.1 ABC transporter ATP-binding protein [Viridibacillus sp. JNUCC-6]